MPLRLLACLLLICGQACAADFALKTPAGMAAVLAEDTRTMHLAANLLRKDLQAVGGAASPEIRQLADCPAVCIVIGRHDSPLLRQIAQQEGLDFTALSGEWERYIRIGIASRLKPGTRLLIIAGSDTRGAIYGAIDVTRELGVSAWEWWADVAPTARDTLSINGERIVSDRPSVRYRGIFLNDEDWGLQPWAAQHDPAGDIGPATYARIFELMWRLKANLVWPAMHDVTQPFYRVAGNAQTADDYAIVVGTSHAEPMMRNNVREWKTGQDGPFNFFTNRDALVRYWQQRVDAVHGYENMYSMGIRGVHDSAMEGAATLDQARGGVADVIGVQRAMLAKAHGKPLPQIPQALTVYKEVLDIYNSGLQVPDDVTLVWPDDNYGYLHQLGTPREAARGGGMGLYYHLSYWGRPHDYLWLATTHPGLVREQMQRAVVTETQRVWVANVGDIKPGEYLTQYFLDLAFDNRQLDRSARDHLQAWMCTQFGTAHGSTLADIMMEFYALAWERRPEFMGFSQTEPTTPTRQTDYMQSGGDEAERRLARYAALVQRAEAASAELGPQHREAYFQLVLYPVRAAASLNARILKFDLAAQQARMGRASAASHAQQAAAAQAAIVADTATYNALGGGKWRGMMDAAPRRLPVFAAPVFPTYGKVANGDRTPVRPPPPDRIVTLPASSAQAGAGWRMIDVGSFGTALRSDITLASRSDTDAAPAAMFSFDSKASGAAKLKIVALPVHPLTSANQLRIAVSLDDQPATTLDFATQGRSDEWKRNVLSNTAVRTLTLPALAAGSHRLRVHALDPGFILDRIEVLFDGAPVYYGRPPVP